MPVTLRRPDPAEVPELARICYDAFKDIAESHGFQKDFESPEQAAGFIGLLMSKEQVRSVGAYGGEV